MLGCVIMLAQPFVYFPSLYFVGVTPATAAKEKNKIKRGNRTTFPKNFVYLSPKIRNNILKNERKSHDVDVRPGLLTLNNELVLHTLNCSLILLRNDHDGADRLFQQ